MKKLNLVNIIKSEIKYKISAFPDGQQDVTLEEFSSFYKDDNIVEITSRFNNFKDLELIICATKALRNLGIEEIHLYVPYILGARSDRQFSKGGTSYLRDIIAPILNAQNYKSIRCIDIHNPVMAQACINKLVSYDNLKLVKYALSKPDDSVGHSPDISYIGDNYLLVAPDEGASKKIYELASKMGYKNDIIICSKSRDEEGKLTKCVVPISGPLDKNLVIIDDICDGGGTFLNIAKEIKKNFYFTGKLYLIVTHGIFSKGLLELSKYFAGIYCTNSYGSIRVEDAADARCARIFHQLNVMEW